MSLKKQKLFVASVYTNRISHRELTRFETDNPRIFTTLHAAHVTWELAHEWLVDRCRTDVERAQKELRRAKLRLSRAEAMKKPEPT